MSRINRLLQNFPPTFIIAFFTANLLATALGWLEYYFINIESIPYREAKPPTAGFLFPYQLAVFLPLLLLLAFYPLINQLISKARTTANLRRPIALGIGTFLLSLILQDSSWFILRTVAPTATDPLAYQWIRPTDYTATFLGNAQIVGITIPLWYLVLIPIILATIVSIIISPPQN